MQRNPRRMFLLFLIAAVAAASAPVAATSAPVAATSAPAPAATAVFKEVFIQR